MFAAYCLRRSFLEDLGDHPNREPYSAKDENDQEDDNELALPRLRQKLPARLLVIALANSMHVPTRIKRLRRLI
jgi:hypothetical protein